MRLSKTHVDGGFGRTKTGLRFWRKLFYHPILYIQQTRTLYMRYYTSDIIHSTDTHYTCDIIHPILYIQQTCTLYMQYHTADIIHSTDTHTIHAILYIRQTRTLYIRYYASDTIHSTDTHTIHAILYIRYYTFNLINDESSSSLSFSRPPSVPFLIEEKEQPYPTVLLLNPESAPVCEGGKYPG